MKNILSRLLKYYYGNSIIGKPFYGTTSKLYYEKSQHLLFAFRRKIQYEFTLQKKISKFITSGSLVFDIGGNIGQYTLLFSHLTGSTGKVVTLEPDSVNFAFLQFNIAINQLKNVCSLQKGVSNEYTFLEFYRDTETGGRKGSFNKKFVENNFKGHKETVETITLDKLVDIYGIPKFIKIDVEGFEIEVIDGLTRILADTTFMIEVRRETKALVFNYFHKRKFACFYVDEENDMLVRNENDIPDFANLLFRKD